MTGRTVPIPVEPRRVLSLCSSVTDTAVRIGAAETLAAIDAYNRLIPDASKASIIGKGSAISQEDLLSLGIDLAFIWWYQDDAASLLERLSIPVIRIRSLRLKQVPAMIRLVGKCLNCTQRANNLADEVAGYVRTAAAERATPSTTPVYLELYGPLKTVGKATYIDDLIELAGGKNIADDASGSVLVSIERLIETDPEVILFVKGFATVESVAARSGMAKMTAVQTKCIYPVDRYWLVPGAGFPTAVENLRKLFLVTSGENPKR